MIDDSWLMIREVVAAYSRIINHQSKEIVKDLGEARLQLGNLRGDFALWGPDCGGIAYRDVSPKLRLKDGTRDASDHAPGCALGCGFRPNVRSVRRRLGRARYNGGAWASGLGHSLAG